MKIRPSSLRLAWRISTRNITTTTTTTSPSRPGKFANIKHDLLSRPPRTYYDYLTPTNSHLLNVTLADHFPPPTTSTTTSDEADHWTLPSISSSSPLSSPGPNLLPQGHHLVYFPATHPTSALRPDGTDTDHWPGPPFTRRLWAGGSVHFSHDALRLDGRRAVCVESVGDVRLKPAPVAKGAAGEVHGGGEGEDRVLAAGDKLFVDILRSYGSAVDGTGAELKGLDAVEQVTASPAITERRTLVFLNETDATAAAAAAAAGERKPRSTRKDINTTAHHSVTITPNPALLFRFSALSFNAHAIHLDPAYTAAAEGYRGRLVHGPLLLVLMLSALRRALDGTGLAVSGLDYRNLEPVYVGEEMRVCVSPGRTRWNVWVEGAGGRRCVKGSAQVVGDLG
ncbi:hypothetical protein VPNG_00951 [Cytospora leucostoma]|uniref:MaoC-like domain-containing protein n=1 Tax=Cytospora leucostoma TaxID=1230097 RepID=A0A423XMB2_9PEZI|nr:hypothetical protein VPNG_00951 [Cytospora leucostoma]